MTTLITVPQTTIPAGSGSFTSAPNAVPAAASKVTMSFTQVAWPNAGDKAIDYTVDLSLDGGANWQTISFGDVSDVTVAGSAFKFGCTLPFAGTPGRRVRISYNFAKALTVSGSLDVS